MLSRDEWKTIESPNDLLGILRNGTVHDERLWFKHPPKEPSTNMLDLVNKTADAEVPLVEKKAVYVEPTDGEVVKRKRGRPRIHAVKEPPAKQPAPPPLPAAVTASLTPTAAAETPAALPKPIPMDTSRSPSSDKTIEIASASHSPTPLSVGEALAFRPQHTQTEPVNVAKLSEVAVTYGHTTALPPIPEHQPAELTPAKPKEFVASTAMIATATPERRSTMTEKQKADTAAAAEEKQRTKEKKEETPPPHLVPFFVDEQLFYQTMPDVQLVKPDDKEFVISTTSRKSADFRSEWNAEKRGEAGGTNAADTPLTTCPKGPTRGVTLAPATRPTPQGARLIVPTLGTPGIPQYVSPDQKLLLVTAHNLVIAHPKADSFANPMNDDLMADYSKIIKKPIDLKTIRKYIDENRIKTLSELNDFYMLMCMNAINFNDKTRAIHKDAFEMRYFCLQTIQNIRHGTTRNAARTTGRKSTFGRELETPMRGVEHSNGDRSRLFRTTGAQPSAIRKVYVRTGVADQPLQ
ncbi:Bromodomain-containing protein 8-like protein [Aphelenchoides fujianensis]|nr:Bromodomain-containing protein 8-like protein [Aphelenchoides fujianensis]